MCSKGQEYAAKKPFERLLTAFDCGPKDPPFQPRTIAWQQTNNKEREHNKVQQAIGREVGFVIRIEGAVDLRWNQGPQFVEPGRHWHHQSKQKVGGAER